MFYQKYHVSKYLQSRFTMFACLFIPVFIFSGCSSLSKNECNKGDWAEIGRKDASNGLLAKKQLRKHQSACSEYNINPNKQVYDLGYSQGLKQFCRQEVGYTEGSNGSRYLAICPVSTERSFLIGYIPGLELAMDNIQNDIDDLKHKRHRIERKLDALDDSDKKSKKQKKRVKKLEDRLDEIQSDILSKRSEMNTFRSWHAKWVFKLN